MRDGLLFAINPRIIDLEAFRKKHDFEGVGKQVDFDLKTKFEEETKSQAEEIFKKHNIFKDLAADSAPIAPTKEPRLLKKLRKLEREKTLGDRWYGMKKVDLTPELKNDLTVLQMRNYMDPKNHFKGNDSKNLPKYFQIGTVMDDSEGFVSGRIVKSKRKNTIAEQFLLADKELNFSRKRFSDIQREKKKFSVNNKFKKIKKGPKSR